MFAREINSNNVVQSKNPQLTLTQNINYFPKLSNPDKSINFITLRLANCINGKPFAHRFHRLQFAHFSGNGLPTVPMKNVCPLFGGNSVTSAIILF